MRRAIIASVLACLAAGVAFGQSGDNSQADQSAPTKPRRACLFDPVGAGGPLYKLFQPYFRQVADWGYKLDVHTYNDESVAAADFRAGKCDMALLTGLRAIRFVKFAGSLDMVGGLSSYTEEKQAIDAISAPKAAPLMQDGDNEIAGVTPLGRSYLLAHDRRALTDLDHLAGKRVAVLNYDRQATTLAKKAGLSPVPATTTSFGPMFTNHSVDVAYAPALAFEPLELFQGLKDNGGIARFPLGMLSNQIVIHRGRFDEGFGQRSRAWVAKHLFALAAAAAQQAEQAVPIHDWVPITAQQQAGYRELFRSVRQTLWDDGWYAHRMQRLLKKIRCYDQSGAAECSLPSEGGPIN